MNNAQTIPIYVRTRPVARVGLRGRVLAFGFAGVCLTVLLVGAWIRPDGRGVGTHEQLGMPPCGFIRLFGLPCPTCGFTTSFSLFAHGRLIASFLNQPAGFVCALVSALVFWGGMYVGVTGVAVHRFFERWFTAKHVFMGGLGLLLAWAYKIVLMKLGVI